MEAHALRTVPANGRGETAGRISGAALVKVGAIAGLAGGIVMAMWQMVVGAIATEPTAIPGIDSSFWTAVTSIPSVIFGQQWFHGSFEFWAVLLGLMGHMMNSMILGIVGVTLVTTLLGKRLTVPAAMAFGLVGATLLRRRPA